MIVRFLWWALMANGVTMLPMETRIGTEFCGSLIEVSNAHHNGSDQLSFPSGAWIKYECNENYSIASPSHMHVFCKNGRWMGYRLFRCKKKCGQPPVVDGTKISGVGLTSYPHDHIIKYHCKNDGGADVVMVGYPLVICSEGEWKKYEFGCVAYCRVPETEGVESAYKKERTSRYWYTYQNLHLEVNEKVEDNTEIYFVCEDGYVPRKEESVTCLNGNWEPLIKCYPKPCRKITIRGKFSVIREGSYIPPKYKRYYTYNSGTKVTVKCDRGYISKQKTATCMYGQWSPRNPDCSPAPCIISRLQNGKFKSRRRYFQTGEKVEHNERLMIECDEGFESDVNEANCKYGRFDPVPSCKEAPCIISRLQNGKFKSRRRYFQRGEKVEHNERLMIECDEGFESDVNEANCKYGRFDPVPSCKEAPCIISRLQNGKFKSRRRYFQRGEKVEHNERLMIECDEGFESDVNEANCKYGRFDPVPSCKEAPCIISRLQNGKFKSRRRYFQRGEKVEHNERLMIECDEGFESDVNEANCKYGRFDPVPSCKEAPCIISRLQNGKFKSRRRYFQRGEKVEHNERLMIECDEGFESDVNEANCKYGRFDPVPSCKEEVCGEPDVIANSQHNGSMIKSFPHGSWITYRCNENYFAGNLTLLSVICMNGEWLGYRKFLCKESCGPPPTVDGADHNGFGILHFSHGHILEYHCTKKYKTLLVGLPQALCDNGIWKRFQFSCKPITCTLQGHIKHGRFMDYFEFNLGSTVTIRCDEGYELEGNSTITCTLGGQWDGSFPKCNLKSCKHPGEIRNGRLSSNNFTIGSTVQVICDNRHQLDGNPVLTCMSNREWDFRVPECNQGTEHNRTEIEEFQYGSAFEYWCIGNYSTVGLSVVMCLNGTWTDGHFACEKKCTSPPTVNDAVHNATGDSHFLHDSVVVYLCMDNYSPVGSPSAVCKNGRWEIGEFTCKKKCISPPTVNDAVHNATGDSNFLHDSVVVYLCRDNYSPVGSPSAVCKNGRWEIGEFTCKKKCISPPTVNDAVHNATGDSHFLHDSVVVYLCMDNYSPVGSPSAVCKNGRWEIGEFTCKKKCTSPPTVNDAVHNATGDSHFLHDSVVVYLCMDNYSPVGSPSAVCKNGRWEIGEFTCKKKCTSPPTVNDAVHNATGDSHFLHDSVVVYLCMDNYSPVGSPSAVCKNGRWEIGEFTCKKKCTSPPTVNDAVHNATGDSHFLHDSVVVYLCMDNYSPVGSPSAVCKNGRWEIGEFTCKKKCTSPPTVNDAVHNATGDSHFLHDSVVVYLCMDNYSPVGSPSAVCKNGRWEIGEFTCKKKCTSPPTVNDAVHNATGDSHFLHDSVVVYLCMDNYSPVGSPSAVCKNGRWEIGEFTCKKKCISPPTVNDAVHNATGDSHFLHDSVVVYLCMDNYSPVGSPSAVCKNGRWEIGEFTCKKKCISPPTVNDAVHNATGDSHFLHDSVVVYLCMDNYSPVGSPSAVCKNGRWEIGEFTCKKKCTSPPTVNDAVHNATGDSNFLHDSVVVYLCRDNYSPVGSPSAVCKNGRWEIGEFSCKKPTCSAPDISDMFEVNITQGKTVIKEGTVIHFNCKSKHHKITGIPIAKCVGEKWDGPVNIGCVSICKCPSSIKNGFIFCGESTVKFSCIKDYELHGPDEMLCQDSQWSLSVGKYPKCVKVIAVLPS